jgi:hypothetical protein
MTAVFLLDRLREFIEDCTKDIILDVRPVAAETPIGYEAEESALAPSESKRAAEVHLFRLPNKNMEINRIPYVLIRVLKGKDEQKSGEESESECSVRIIAVTYSDNDSEGERDALNVITSIRIALLKEGIIGEQFFLRKPLEYMIYEDDTSPYFVAEMIATFEMPAVVQEVQTLH